MTARHRFAVFGALSAIALLASPLACDETPEDRNDGESCGDNGDCKSGRCVSSTCSGSTCDLAAPVCEEGWQCTRTAAGASTGTCNAICGGKPAAAPCNDGRYCANGLCREGEENLGVTITTAGVCSPNTVCTFAVTIRNGSGAYSSLVVAWGDGTADGTFDQTSSAWQATEGIVTLLVQHTYANAGEITVRATATDVRGEVQSDDLGTIICLTAGNTCDGQNQCCGTCRAGTCQ